MKLKGATFLKVMGILLIIGAAFAIIGGIMGLSGSALLHAGTNAFIDTVDEAAGSMDMDVSSEAEEAKSTLGQGIGIFYATFGLLLLGGVLELIAGIKGIGGSKHPEKARSCVTWGIIIAVLAVIDQILSIVAKSFNVGNLISILVLPVLYIVAAVQLKGAYASAGQQPQAPNV